MASIGKTGGGSSASLFFPLDVSNSRVGVEGRKSRTLQLEVSRVRLDVCEMLANWPWINWFRLHVLSCAILSSCALAMVLVDGEEARSMVAMKLACSVCEWQWLSNAISCAVIGSTSSDGLLPCTDWAWITYTNSCHIMYFYNDKLQTFKCSASHILAQVLVLVVSYEVRSFAHKLRLHSGHSAYNFFSERQREYLHCTILAWI